MHKFLKNNIWIIFILSSLSIYTHETEEIDREFPQHDTNKYSYFVHVQEEIATKSNNDLIKDSEVISDVTHNHYFNSGKTRMKTTKSIQNNKQIIKIEKWTTKNVSYFTAFNGSLISGLIVTFLGLQYVKYLIAYHESAHALMAALILDENADSVKYATTNISFGRLGSFGYVQKKAPSTYLSNKEELLQYYKNRVMIFLSGGIGMDIYREKRLPVSQFLDVWQTFMKGMGSFADIDFDNPSDDVSLAVDSAGLYALIESDQYSRLEDGTIRIDGKLKGDQVIKIIENFYEDAYDILDAHKDRLNTMANSLYSQGTIHGPEIYDIAGVDFSRAEL